MPVPETEIVKNKRDEIGQVPGVVQEEDTLPNCSAPVKMTGMGQNVMIKIPKVTSNHWAMNPHMALTDNSQSEFPPSHQDPSHKPQDHNSGW